MILLRPVLRSVPPERGGGRTRRRLRACPAYCCAWSCRSWCRDWSRWPGLSFLIGWGEFLFGLTLAEGPDVQPVTVLLNAFVGQQGTGMGSR